MPEQDLRQHNTTQRHGPMYPHYSTHSTQMQSFATWPTTSKQKPENLSDGFFYTGRVSQIKPLFITNKQNTFRKTCLM